MKDRSYVDDPQCGTPLRIPHSEYRLYRSLLEDELRAADGNLKVAMEAVLEKHPEWIKP